MKAIIFDLDNTLIDWIDEYKETIREALIECHVQADILLVEKVNRSFNEYDKSSRIFNKKDLLIYVNRMCNLDLPIKFINKIEKYQGNCASYDEELIDTIDYLSKKYDLYLVSNWFTKTQKNRLKKAGIYKYFKKVYGADQNYKKPDPKAYFEILKKYNVEDIISIGDSYKNDIEPALKIGMNVLWKTKKKTNKCKTFDKITELKKIL